MKRIRFLLLLLAAPLLVSCKWNDDADAMPPPQKITNSSVAYFCSMSVNEHEGPKAQIFIRDMKNPFWFASVSDAFAFLFLPETPKAVTAIYVNDMAKAKDWAHPGPGTWIDAHKALYVIGSRRRGGMNAHEAAPFGTAAAAEKFVADEGGRIVRFDDMPHDYVLGSKSGEN